MRATLRRPTRLTLNTNMARNKLTLDVTCTPQKHKKNCKNPFSLIKNFFHQMTKKHLTKEKKSFKDKTSFIIQSFVFFPLRAKRRWKKRNQVLVVKDTKKRDVY
jgi:hypothetical protein